MIIKTPLVFYTLQVRYLFINARARLCSAKPTPWCKHIDITSGTPRVCYVLSMRSPHQHLSIDTSTCNAHTHVPG